jgi:hypothetical protein
MMKFIYHCHHHERKERNHLANEKTEKINVTVSQLETRWVTTRTSSFFSSSKIYLSSYPSPARLITTTKNRVGCGSTRWQDLIGNRRFSWAVRREIIMKRSNDLTVPINVRICDPWTQALSCGDVQCSISLTCPNEITEADWPYHHGERHERRQRWPQW